MSLPTYLFVLPWSPRHLGGVSQVVVNLARQMILKGSFDPLVLVTDWEAKEPVWETVHGIRTVRWRVRGPLYSRSPKQRIAHFFWKRRFSPAFEKFCNELNVAVVNSHYPTDAVLTLDALAKAFVSPPKTIVSFHGSDVTEFQALDPIMLKTWSSMLLRSQGVVVCSSALGSRVEQTLGIVPSVIRNGIDFAAFNKMAGPLQPGPRRVILNVGKFETQKGQDVLLSAFSTLVGEFADLDLVLIGATDHALEPLKQTCQRLGIQHRVQFLPDMPHHEVARCFAHATIFALPSRREAFGIVLLEAGCLGLPVVASAVGGVPEILEDRVTALLVRPDRPDELAAAIRELLNDRVSSHAMGERLKANVVKNFSWSNAHDLYVRLVQSEEQHTHDIGR